MIILLLLFRGFKKICFLSKERRNLKNDDDKTFSKEKFLLFFPLVIKYRHFVFLKDNSPFGNVLQSLGTICFSHFRPPTDFSDLSSEQKKMFISW